MKLAIVILNWNATDDTIRCIDAVRSWGLAEYGPPVVWVVDNGSTAPPLPEMADLPAHVRVVRSPANVGFAGGNNLALRELVANHVDAVMLLNNDVQIREADVISILETLASDARIGMVGPTLWDGHRLVSAGGRDIGLHVVTHVVPARVPEEPFDVDYVPGTLVVIRREVLSTVGLLDEDYFFSGEMADLCRRAHKAGYRSVIDPAARANHDLQRSSSIRQSLHAYYVMRNRFLFVRKHHPEHLVRLFGLWCIRGLAAAVVAMLDGNVGRTRALGRGLLDGLLGRFGGPVDRAFA